MRRVGLNAIPAGGANGPAVEPGPHLRRAGTASGSRHQERSSCRQQKGTPKRPFLVASLAAYFSFFAASFSSSALSVFSHEKAVKVSPFSVTS